MGIRKEDAIPLRYRLTHSEQSHYSRADYIDDIKKEVEALLNAHASRAEWPRHLSELNHSILTYGISNDMRWKSTHFYLDGTLLPQLASYIQQHEPRLLDCEVTIDDDYQSAGFRLALAVQGRIAFNQKQALLTFKTHCHPINMRFHLS